MYTQTLDIRPWLNSCAGVPADLDPPRFGPPGPPPPPENGQEFSLMSGERSFLNLITHSRTPLDSIRDKFETLIYFVIVQCPSVGTTWYSASCARNGYT